jgi:hypothetical protein
VRLCGPRREAACGLIGNDRTAVRLFRADVAPTSRKGTRADGAVSPDNPRLEWIPCPKCTRGPHGQRSW